MFYPCFMKIFALLIVDVLGLKLQAAFYSNQIFEYYNLFDLDLNEGLESSAMASLINCLEKKNLIAKEEPYWCPHGHGYTSEGFDMKERLINHAHEIEKFEIKKPVTELIFLVNDRLIRKNDLLILRMIFRITKCKGDNWECIKGLDEKIEKYRGCESWNSPDCFENPETTRKYLILFRAYWNILKDYENQSILAITKKAICLFVKDNKLISEADLNNFSNQDDELIFECDEKIKEALYKDYNFSCDEILFSGKFVGFLRYLH